MSIVCLLYIPAADQSTSRIRTHSVVCDAATGAVYPVTAIVKPDEVACKGKELLAWAKRKDLVWFEFRAGSARDIPSQNVEVQIRGFRPKNAARVREAYKQYCLAHPAPGSS